MTIRRSNRLAVSAISFFFLHCIFEMAYGNRTSFLLDEVHSLSELPMVELIHIKSSLVNEIGPIDEDETSEQVSSRTLSYSLPMALPLKASSKKPMRRYGDHYDEKGKDSKISKIFQLAVTSLSFLAFGGYLLTLIITALRRNAGTAGNGNVIVLSNLQGLQTFNRPKRNIGGIDSLESDLEIERFYRGMIMLSRTYAMYN